MAQPIRFVHCAGFRFDSPEWEGPPSWANTRDLDLWQAFEQVLNLCRAEKAHFLFITGNLFQQEYTRKYTVERVAKALAELKDVRIFIVPGESDPLVISSVYRLTNWPANVHIFVSNMDRVDISSLGVIVYGIAWTSYRPPEVFLNNLKNNVEENSPLSFMLLPGGVVVEQESLVSEKDIILLEDEVKSSRLTYLALGSAQRWCGPKQAGDTVWANSGAIMARSFGENWSHGVMVGETDGEFIQVEFVKLEQTKATVLPPKADGQRDLFCSEDMKALKAEYNLLRMEWVEKQRRLEESRLLQIEIKSLRAKIDTLKENIAHLLHIQHRVSVYRQNPDYRELRRMRAELARLDDIWHQKEQELNVYTNDPLIDWHLIEALRQEGLEWVEQKIYQIQSLDYLIGPVKRRLNKLILLFRFKGYLLKFGATHTWGDRLRGMLKYWPLSTKDWEEVLIIIRKVDVLIRTQEAINKERTYLQKTYDLILGSRNMDQLARDLEPLTDLEREALIEDKKRERELHTKHRRLEEKTNQLKAIEHRLRQIRLTSVDPDLEKKMEEIEKQLN
ncbi:MAG: hypothetical protein GX248_05865 [Peptococcaceae bacterium]|jgi:DNA repair exonuclease SbcCD nuclease subunit|nr:hypothetical protein [Peptococcaceae bacterium]